MILSSRHHKKSSTGFGGDPIFAFSRLFSYRFL